MSSFQVSSYCHLVASRDLPLWTPRGTMSASATENEAKMEPRGFVRDAAAAATAEGGGMMSCGAHPSRPLTRHRICSIAERAN